MALQSEFIKPLSDKSSAYMQHVQTIVTSSNAAFTKAVKAKSAEAQKAFAGMMDNLVKNAPAGTEPLVAAFQKALTVGQTAIESAQAQAKKSVESAQANMLAAATQTADAVKKAPKLV